MTDRKQALIDLRDKVKAGEWQAVGDGDDSWLAIFDAELQPFHAYIYEAWGRNSFDAAKALHKAVLPGADYSVSGSKVCVGNGFCVKTGGNPARAWLLAILEALIAQEADA